MIQAVLLTVLAAFAGTVLTYLYAESASLVTRIAFGVVSGLAAIALVAFVLAHVVGLGIAAPAAAIIAAAVTAVLLITRPAVRHALRDQAVDAGAQLTEAARNPRLSTLLPALYGLAVVVLLVLAFDRVLIVDESGVSTGYANNLGDLPFHMQVVASFAWGGNVPPEDPTYAGTGFAYPYMADFFVAMAVALGATMRDAFLVMNLSLALALAALLHRFTRLLTGDSLAALIAPMLVFLSGGLGWIMLVDEVRAGGQGLIAHLGALPHDYTIGVEGYRWGNAITTLLVTQRSLLFGLPVALTIFCLLFQLIHRAGDRLDEAQAREERRRTLRAHEVLRAIRRRPEALAAGILTGLLPLIHAHSFVVVMVTAFFLGLLFRQWREGRWLPWAVYVVAALAIALPEIWWSTHDSTANAGTFFGIEIGWDRGGQNPIWFWFVNTGLFIPLSLLPILIPHVRARLPSGLLLFTLPFLIWFALPNVVKLAPWVWDNIKVLFYWYVGFVPLVALVIAWLMRDRFAAKLVGVALLATLVIAGSLDVWRVVSRQSVYREFDSDAITLGAQILDRTPPRSLILHAPTWNPPVFLTGRRSLLGYTGYIWAHGLDYAARETHIRRIYAGEADAKELLAAYGIDYIEVTPLEREYTTVNDEFLAQFTEVARSGEYRLLQVTP